MELSVVVLLCVAIISLSKASTSMVINSKIAFENIDHTIPNAVNEISKQMQAVLQYDVMFISSMSQYNDSSALINHFVDLTLIKIQATNRVSVSSTFVKPTVQQIRTHIIIFVDSYDAFSKIFRSLLTNERQGAFLVMLLGINDHYVQMKRILEDMWSQYWIHVIVAYSESPEEVNLYTFFPYSPIQCEKVRPFLMD